MKLHIPPVPVWRGLLVALTLTLIAACSSGPKVSGGVPPAPPANTYVIGIPDLLQVTVWEQPDLSGQVLVRRDGMISIPLLGDVVAAGSTPEDLARQVEAGLARYVNAPRVDVAVVEMRSQVISVIGGGIQNSGVIELRSDMRVVDAIAEMGGLTPFAKESQIRVIRGDESYGFDYDAFMRGKSPNANFLLAPGDTIVVPE